MSTDDKDLLLDHEYDGIQELDNNLPMWWLWTFFGAIIFAFIYWLHYSFTQDGPNLDEELASGLAKIEQQRKAGEVQATNKKEMSEDEWLKLGGSLFKSNCASCHREDGGGTIGPNLTDSYWIHGSDTENLTNIVKKGILDKGMPPWENILRPQQVQAVVKYVESMKNTNVKNGKEPQGDKVL